MCIEYDRTPVKTDTYLLFVSPSVECFTFCLWRRNRSIIDCGVRVVVGVGVKAISLAPLFCWADSISYFLSHKFLTPLLLRLLLLLLLHHLLCCLFLLVLLVSSHIVVSSVCFSIKNYILYNNVIMYCSRLYYSMHRYINTVTQ